MSYNIISSIMYSLSRRPALVLLSFTFLLSNCSLQKAPTINDETKDPKALFDISKYPLKQEILLGTAFGYLKPKLSFTIYAPHNSELELLMNEFPSHQSKDFIWGKFDTKEIEKELEKHLNKERYLIIKEKYFNELELPKEKLNLEKNLLEAEAALSQAKIFYNIPDLEELTELFPESKSFLGMNPKAMTRIEKETSLHRKAYDFLNNEKISPLHMSILELREQWELKKIEFEESIAEASIKMPFNGKIHLFIDFVKGVKTYPVKNNQRIAEIRDLENIYLKIPVIDPAWLSMGDDKLRITLDLQSNITVNGSFSKRITEHSNRGENLFFLFRFDANEQLHQLVGSRMTCKLWYDLPSASSIIPKFDLSYYFPNIKIGKNWYDFIEDKLPGMKFISEGENHIAIQAK